MTQFNEYTQRSVSGTIELLLNYYRITIELQLNDAPSEARRKWLLNDYWMTTEWHAERSEAQMTIERLFNETLSKKNKQQPILIFLM